MDSLKQNPTLKDLADYEVNVCRKRGFENHDRGQLFAHMLEELGELGVGLKRKTFWDIYDFKK